MRSIRHLCWCLDKSFFGWSEFVLRWIHRPIRCGYVTGRSKSMESANSSFGYTERGWQPFEKVVIKFKRIRSAHKYRFNEISPLWIPQEVSHTVSQEPHPISARVHFNYIEKALLVDENIASARKIAKMLTVIFSEPFIHLSSLKLSTSLYKIFTMLSLCHTLKSRTIFPLQVFILSLPARVAAVWFGPDQVSSACSIGVFGNQVSVCIIY